MAKVTDLAGIRDAPALANLPADEQKAFTQLWADVAGLLKQVESPLEQAARGDWSAATAGYARVVAVQPLPAFPLSPPAELPFKPYQ